MTRGLGRGLAGTFLFTAVLGGGLASAAQRPPVAKSTSTPVSVVTAESLEQLPTCGRVVSDLVTLAPSPALAVAKVEIAVDGSALGQPTAGRPAGSLPDGLTIRFGNGPEQSAAEPFCVDSLELLRQPGTFSYNGSPVGTFQLQPHPRPATAFTAPDGSPSPYFMAPLLLPGDVQVVRGPFTGPVTIEVNGVPALVLAQTPRTIYWRLPPDTPSGRANVVVRTGGDGASFAEHVLGLAMSADDLHLIKGQSTTLHATVYGPDEMPVEAWTAGNVSEVIDLPKVRQLFPGFNVPAPGAPGVVFFRLDNATRDTVSLSPSNHEAFTAVLTRTDFERGPYQYTGRIHSRKGGDFAINGVVVAFFAPVAGTPIAQSGTSGR